MSHRSPNVMFGVIASAFLILVSLVISLVFALIGVKQ